MLLKNELNSQIHGHRTELISSRSQIHKKRTRGHTNSTVSGQSYRDRGKQVVDLFTFHVIMLLQHYSNALRE